MKKKPIPDTETVPANAVRDLLATVQSQHETIRGLLDKVRELKAGERWNSASQSSVSDSTTNDLSIITWSN